MPIEGGADLLLLVLAGIHSIASTGVALLLQVG
jgi:hypothetical protein